MNCQLTILIVLLIICISKLEKTTELFTTCTGNNCKGTNPEHLYNVTKFSDYQPANILEDDVTINMPKYKCNNTLYNDLCCKNCSWDENGKWSCSQCRKKISTKTKKQSRYLRAMKAVNKIRDAFEASQISEYTYHKLFAKWLQVYYDVTLLPKDKVEQLFCATYLSIIDSAPKDTKHIYEDFIYNTWPAKCSRRIPSILFGDMNNVVDVSAPTNLKNLPKSPDQKDMESLLNDIKQLDQEVKTQETVDISDFRKDFDDLPWKFNDKLPHLRGRQAMG